MAARLRSLAWTIGLGLLLGGAAGNLGDRLFRAPGPLRGSVVDWLNLPHFPWTFNLADASITCAAVLIGILTLCGVRIDGAAGHARAPAETAARTYPGRSWPAPISTPGPEPCCGARKPPWTPSSPRRSTGPAGGGPP